MSVQPILPVKGVPDEFIRVVNDRLRELGAIQASAATAVSADAAGAPYAIGWDVFDLLAIEADAAPAHYLTEERRPRLIVAHLAIAATGAAVTVQVTAGSLVYATLTIPAGSLSVSLVPTTSLPADRAIGVSVTAVGTTLPGYRLVVTAYF